jgi:hypothetical protein
MVDRRTQGDQDSRFHHCGPDRIGKNSLNHHGAHKHEGTRRMEWTREGWSAEAGLTARRRIPQSVSRICRKRQSTSSTTPVAWTGTSRAARRMMSAITACPAAPCRTRPDGKCGATSSSANWEAPGSSVSRLPTTVGSKSIPSTDQGSMGFAFLGSTREHDGSSAFRWSWRSRSRSSDCPLGSVLTSTAHQAAGRLADVHERGLPG